MSKFFRIISLIVVAVLALSACNLPTTEEQTGEQDANAISTNAALTVEALLAATQAVVVNNPTLPPALPTNTAIPVPPTATIAPPTLAPLPTATANCDLAQFITDVTVPDGTNFNAGDTFTKTWRIRNAGTCTWSGYALVFDSGDAMSGVSPISIGTVAPGQEVDLSANLKAPASNGTYRGYWRIRNASGVLIPVQGGTQGKSFYVEIKVGGGSGSGSGSGAFAVTSVSMSVSGACGGFTISANITVNKAGSVTYKWIRSDGATGSIQGPVVFAAAGSQTVNTTWAVSAPASSFWMDIYIDDPNHQQFGRANFSCP